MFKKIMLFLALAVGMLSAEPYFKTDTEATKKATELGYVKIKEISNGQAVYEKTKKSRVVMVHTMQTCQKE